MDDKTKTSSIQTEAEYRLRVGSLDDQDAIVGETVSAVKEKLLYELHVHQIELEMQNEELRKTQVALEESRDHYLEFFDFAPVGYITLSRDALVTEINLTGASMLGGERGKLMQVRFARLVAPEDRDRWHRYFMAVIQHDGKQTCDLCLQRVDGSRQQVQLDSKRLVRDTGLPVVRIVLTDITERKKAEEDLRIAATVFNSQEGMLITDSKSAIVRVNDAFSRITGYSADEVLGKNPRMLSSGHQDAAFYAAMWEKINRYGFWEGEIWNKRKNGEIYPEQLIITAVKNESGAVKNYVASLTDITMSRVAADEIQHLAFYDMLTQLPNRRLLIDRLKYSLASSARRRTEGALLFLDLDNFKQLNDTLGHDIGDELLRQVAKRIESCIREGDTVARLGGDEFVVMLEGLSEQMLEAATQTEAIGTKILSALNVPYQLGTHNFHNTASIGATLFSNHRSGIEELFKQADLAMYQAKKDGRNALRFFDPKMQASINARMVLESELHSAIDNGQFRLYYQIQVNNLRRAIGTEALIRWIHPKRGLVSPADFIPLAEETGLIIRIGQWVLEVACAQLKSWQNSAHTRNLTVSVNVSAKQFHEDSFVTQVKDAVQRHAINPKLLKLEPTESILLKNIEDTIVKMNALRLIGVNFTLDDFGTGFSSLLYLKKLPLYQLKIDQTFVRDLEFDENDRAIVRTIIAMAKSLNLGVIAEGVENEQQLRLLQDKGCNQYQGYLFGKPLPVDKFEAALNSM